MRYEVQLPCFSTLKIKMTWMTENLHRHQAEMEIKYFKL